MRVPTSTASIGEACRSASASRIGRRHPRRLIAAFWFSPAIAEPPAPSARSSAGPWTLGEAQARTYARACRPRAPPVAKPLFVDVHGCRSPRELGIDHALEPARIDKDVRRFQIAMAE